jgi:LmbE family N-acetylglucosaminyl deacetylase
VGLASPLWTHTYAGTFGPNRRIEVPRRQVAQSALESTMLLKLMAVLAHPDDESLGVGGTLAKYAAEGVATSLVTATLGQRGRFRGHRHPPEHPGQEELARIRAGELRAAAATLGIADVTVFDYVDQDLDRADPSGVIARIAREIRRARPQVVITFPHDGSYGHPDHIAISQFTTAALVAAADPSFPGTDGAPHTVSKLYYMAWPQSVWNAYEGALKKATSVVDGVERQSMPWPDWAVTTVIDTRAHSDTAWRAVSCHDSQIAAYEALRHLSPEGHEAVWGTQCFYRVLSLVNGGRQREHDLFEGLR